MSVYDCSSGVYCWKNKSNGKVYVGSAVNLIRRFREHRSKLYKGEHVNKHLQYAWNKYGSKAFSLSILEHCPTEDLLERETYWIAELNAADPEHGYNICLIAGSRLGVPHSQAARDKMSATKKGMIGPRTGAVLSDKTKEKIGNSNRDKKASDAARAKMSAVRKGKKQTEEHRLNSKANHWSKGPNAEAIGVKISNGLSGKKHTEEFKRKMSETKLRQAAEKRKAKRLESIGSNGGGTLFD